MISKETNDSNGLSILILNAHWNNRGDEAALRAMIDSLKSILLIKNIKIMINPNITDFPYKDIEIIDPFPVVKIELLSLTKLILDIFLILFTLGNKAFTSKGKKFLYSVHDADIIIHAPGGPMIGDIYGGKISEILTLFKFLVPIFKSKPIFFYAPSMGPFSNNLKNILRKFILKRVTTLIVREKISYNYLKKQLKLDSYVTIDSAFQNDIRLNYLDKYHEISELIKIINNNKVVGMTVTDLSWHPSYKDNSDLKRRIKKSLFKTVDFMINKGYLILLIPQLFGEQKKLEHSLLQDIQKLNHKKIFIFPPNLDAYAQQAIMANLFCILGMRYHPNIFAAKIGTPSIAIYYEHKTKGFMEEAGLKDLIIDVKDISENKIIDKFIYLEKNYDEIKKRLEMEAPILKDLSKQTTKIILKEINRIKTL